MLDALLVATALTMPIDRTLSDRGERPVVVVSQEDQARWHDSGNVNVWKGVPEWIRSLGMCIRAHESHHNYNAENPISSASGAYQYIDSTWRGVSEWVDGADKYPRASSAPPHIQDKVFIHTIRHGGIRAWHGTWCPGT